MANRLTLGVFPLVLGCVALNAQTSRQENVPLTNWATPLYWQPGQAEREIAGRAQPQLKFSANAVSADALTFVAITPCRLVDTRGMAAGFNGISPFSGPSIAAAATINIPVQSATEASADTTPAPCGVIPTIAQAYSFNLTVVPHAGGAVDFVSMWPGGGAQPFVATLNDPQGAIVANAAIVPAGSPTGGINVFNAGPGIADVIIDMNGYFAAPTDVSGNTAVGLGTLTDNTSGANNTASGNLALTNNTTGSSNTASGALALQSNSSGSNNTAVGQNALGNNTSGGDNTAIGLGALSSNTFGNFNTAVGYNAGQAVGGSQTVGVENTFIGFQAGPGTTNSLIEATAIGAAAIVSEDFALILGGSGNDAVTVGIGTASPFNDYALDVEATTFATINGGVVVNAGGGNLYLGMTSGVHKFRVDTTGKVFADGGSVTSGADFAESVAVSGNQRLYAPGDLLVIEHGARRTLSLSRTPYSTLVAGIYSTKPGVLATPHSIDDELDGEVPLAMVGIVPCKVTTENGAIREGDLLVTSSKPGYAMRGKDRRKMLGAVVGKALEPLPKGEGVIQVLVTLQ